MINFYVDSGIVAPYTGERIGLTTYDYGNGFKGSYWDGEFGGYMTMAPNLFLPFLIQTTFYLDFHMSIEHCCFHKMMFKQFPGGLHAESTLECSYYDCSDGLAPMWPDRRTEEQLRRDGPNWKHFSCPDPWYLINISKEEYNEWLDTELVYQGDYGNLGFTHAIGINREYLWRGFH